VLGSLVVRRVTLSERPGERLPRRGAPLLVTLVAVVAGGTAAWWGFPPAALAYDNCGTLCTCGTGNSTIPEYYTQATNDLGASYQSYGVKAGNSASTGDEVFSLPDVECVHVSSLQVESKSFDFVEVGWHTQQIGIPSNDQGPQGSGDPVDSPRVMYAYTAFGAYSCHEDARFTLTPGSSYRVSLRNLADNPGTWQILFGTTDENDVALEFQHGAGATSGERHYVSPPPDQTIESAKSDFTAMQYWQQNPPPGGSPSWVNWASHQCYLGPHSAMGAYQDPAFSNQFPSGDSEVTVTLNATQC
jgi:hypothetical protein